MQIKAQKRKDDLRENLHADLPQLLARLFPAGVQRGKDFLIGNVQGQKGDSLVIAMQGTKAGLWHDFSTGEGGDIFDLLMAALGLDNALGFNEVLAKIEAWHRTPQIAPARSIPKAELPKPTCHWVYNDSNGKPVAKVFRYDLPDGGKEFRPYDLISKRWKAPNPRPLYNLPALAEADTVIIAEGEKCAQALIDRGYCATTAMNGANAPIDKTDWSPLIRKSVLIWPDNDSSGQNYAQTLARTIETLGVKDVRLLAPPSGKPPKWDAADAVKEDFDIDSFLKQPPPKQSHKIPAFSLHEFLSDTSPPPIDLIAPRILTPGGLLVLGGAPKVGKSDFLLAWLAHMAAGRPFLDMKPPRRLRVFYLQAEIEQAYLKERITQLSAYDGLIEDAGSHLIATPRLRLILDENGVKDVTDIVKSRFGSMADILVIDPIRNVYDLDGKSENDNSAMLRFLTERIDVLRDLINPQAGIILVHHTRKLPKSQFREDPFQSLSGAGSLRSYYTTGMMLFRDSEQNQERELHFELRNGAPLPMRPISKHAGQWVEHKPQQGRTSKPKVDNRAEKILALIADEAKQGRLHTMHTFCSRFGKTEGMGGFYGLTNHIKQLSHHGHVRYVLSLPDAGFPKTTSTLGYLVVERMRLLIGDKLTAIQPTHTKGKKSGKPEPIENDLAWPDRKGGAS